MTLAHTVSDGTYIWAQNIGTVLDLHVSEVGHFSSFPLQITLSRFFNTCRTRQAAVKRPRSIVKSLR